MAKEYKSGVVLVGDSTGAVKAVKLTRKELKTLSEQSERAENATKRLSAQTKALTASFNLLKGAAATAAAGFSAKIYLEQADAFNALTQKIKTAVGTSGDYVAVQKQIVAISQQTGVSLETTSTLFQRFSISRDSLRATNAELLKFTEGVQKLGVLGGSGSEELNNALRQLSQGLSAGVLRAEEFNALIEQTPRIVQEIERGMNIAAGSLGGLVRSGKVLSDDVFQAILARLPEIDKEFSSFDQRIGNSTTRISNAFTLLIGKVDSNTGLSGAFKKASEALAELLETMANGGPSISSLESEIAKIQKSLDSGGGGGQSSKGRKKALESRLAELQAELLKLKASGGDIDSLVKRLEQVNAAIAGTDDTSLTTGSGQSKKATAYAKLLEERKQLIEALAQAQDKARQDEAAAADNARLKEADKQKKAKEEEIKLAEKAAKKLAKINEKKAQSDLAVIRSLGEQIQAYQLVGVEAEVHANILKLSTKATDEHKQAVEALTRKLYEYKEIQKEQLELEKQGDAFEDAWLQMWRRLDETAVDVWRNIGDGAGDTFERVKDLFRDMLAEMAHLAITKPILLNVQTKLGEAIGVNAASSAAGNAGGSFLGSALGSTLGAGGSAGFGGVNWAQAGRAIAIRDSIPYLAALYSAYQGYKQHGIEGAAVQGGATYAGAAYGASVGGVPGAIIGGAIGAFGGEKLNTSLFGGDYETTSSSLRLRVVNDRVRGTERARSVKDGGALHGDSSRLYEDKIETDFRLGLQSVLDDSRAAVIATFRSLGADIEDDVLSGLTTGSKTIDTLGKSDSEIAKRVQKWMSSVVDRMVNTVSSAISSFAELQDIAFRRENVIDLFSTQDQLFSKLSDYLEEGFAAVGQSIPATREGFKSLIESLDVTTEAGLRAFNTLEPLGPQLVNYYSELERQQAEHLRLQQQRVKDFQNLYNGIVSAELDRVFQYLSVGLGIQDAALKAEPALDDLIENIITKATEEFIKQDQELYNVQKQRYDAAIRAEQQLASFIDGLQVGGLSPLTPQQQLEEARSQFYAAAAQGLAGDADAATRSTSLASQYLEAYQGVNASAGYRDVFRDVNSTLMDLQKTLASTAEPTTIGGDYLSRILGRGETQAFGNQLYSALSSYAFFSGLDINTAAQQKGISLAGIDYLQQGATTNTANALLTDISRYLQEVVQAVKDSGYDTIQAIEESAQRQIQLENLG